MYYWLYNGTKTDENFIGPLWFDNAPGIDTTINYNGASLLVKEWNDDILLVSIPDTTVTYETIYTDCSVSCDPFNKNNLPTVGQVLFSSNGLVVTKVDHTNHKIWVQKPSNK